MYLFGYSLVFCFYFWGSILFCFPGFGFFFFLLLYCVLLAFGGRTESWVGREERDVEILRGGEEYDQSIFKIKNCFK